MSRQDQLLIAGGGLAGCLTALALARLRPEIPFLLVEEGTSFGGNHVWSFFDPDVAAKNRWLVDPLIAGRWSGYDIAFPKRRRGLDTPYNSLSSKLLDSHMRETLRADQYRLSARIDGVGPDSIQLEGGEVLNGAVIDARGAGTKGDLSLGWQKFVGRLLRFDAPHGLERPIVMDATVDQADGYRFVYCLPFTDTDMLVEDTYYSLDPGLDRAEIGARIDAYVRGREWPGFAVLEEETGVLPVAMGGSVESLWEDDPGVARIGLRGGFFHPTTGYSLPDAVRIAVRIAGQKDMSSGALHRLLLEEAKRLWRERRFYRLLDRMLFRAAAPEQRYKVLEHFYRLDEGVIARFYAGRSGAMDKLRILSGKPPVPIGKALASLWKTQ